MVGPVLVQFLVQPGGCCEGLPRVADLALGKPVGLGVGALRPGETTLAALLLLELPCRDLVGLVGRRQRIELAERAPDAVG